jgi:2-iminoacetate synthase ThiH
VAQSHFDKEPRRDEEPWFTCGVNEAFVLTTSGAAQVSGIVYYEQN